MGLPVLEKGCFCLELEICVKIMAWVQLLFVVTTSYRLIAMSVLVMDEERKVEAVEVLVSDNAKAENTVEALHLELLILLWLIAIITFLTILSAVLLLVGAYKKNRRALKIYCMMSMVRISFLALTLLVSLGSIAQMGTYFMENLFYICVSSYFVLCVYSYSQLIKDDEAYQQPALGVSYQQPGVPYYTQETEQ